MTATSPRKAFPRLVAALLGVIVVVAIAILFVRGRWSGLPAAESEAYAETIHEFYTGLASLQVGLIDGAKQAFTRATELAPGEPASWANLGLAHLRLGEFDAAAPAIQRATDLAPSDADIAFLFGRLETARGLRDQGIGHLRRAVQLGPASLHVRMALIQEIENAGGPGADDEAQRLLEEMVELEPGNSALLVERARLAAKRGDAALLRDSVSRLEPFADGWPAEVVEQYRLVQEASAGPNAADAARPVAFLRNVLAQVPAFLESRRRVTPSAELIAEPITRFVRLPVPVSTPAAADTALTFTPEQAGAAPPGGWRAITAISLDGEQAPVLFASDGSEIHRLSAPPAEVLPFPGGDSAAVPPRHGMIALDWNHDFRMDLLAAGAGGVRLFLQSATGSFDAATDAASEESGPLAVDATGAWAADTDMDGDLDAVIGVRAGAPVVLRNNGDGTWLPIQPFADVTGIESFVWGDLDGDGDPDAALIDARSALHVFRNLQAGQFERMEGLENRVGVRALALGDVNADGMLDLVTVEGAGAIQRVSLGTGGWTQERLADWPEAPGVVELPAASPTPSSAPGGLQVMLADLDNNGGVDLLASAASGSAAWLASPDGTFQRIGGVLAADVRHVADLTGDGQLDLVGLSAGQAVRLIGTGAAGYHYQVVRPRAQAAAGDQRINSFGIGGEVEARSGALTQKQPITGPVVHLGLGSRTAIDVTRILWPNGVPQAEFDPPVDAPIVAEQRLKGSCPWIFAYDGAGMQFVTDFLWRSPLGLRINAQDTAGVTQTEDWVKIRGDQLVARDGVYDVRITAELWETHYIDHVSLLVVDRPEDVAIFVDERFAREAPALAVHAMEKPRPVAMARDETGRDVTDLVSARDGRYLNTFERGRYQGVAADHFVEIDLGAEIRPGSSPTWLVAQGWIYPTDSSINVAIGQGGAIVPRGLSLEAQDPDGRWVMVAPDLGFPAGKSKTILIDLGQVARAGLAGARRLRLATNLEIYWDALGIASGLSDSSLRTERVAASTAELAYRGYSEARADARDLPEIPTYERIANTVPRWRDLVGYYTRFGDVRELVAEVEDRYVIMNAGDELRLSFPAPPPPAAGWTRDFVLIGDGWNKDGDFNTGYSKTVLPLPAHGSTAYTAASLVPVLDEDPVYRRYPEDWQRFHTRFITAQPFVRGLYALAAPVEPARSSPPAQVPEAVSPAPVEHSRP